jgi:hypothetical protein
MTLEGPMRFFVRVGAITLWGVAIVTVSVLAYVAY